MITFLVCLALLVGAYFVYGRYLERLVEIDPAAETPCHRCYDGVDYVPLPRWRIFLIQLLNIAGLGPIFGAVLGAAYGPVAFLWITFGGIFLGAMHDFVAGVISLRHDGASLPESAGHYLGRGTRLFMRLFSVGLMVLVGAVFLSQPASLIVNRLDIPALEGEAFGGFSWLMLLVLGVILLYYVAATLLPVDKIIGRIYPVFGVALLFMALGVLFVLLFSGRYTIPEFTSFENCLTDAREFPIVPMLFTTIACGAISGFHATQSPLMARCMRSERCSMPRKSATIRRAERKAVSPEVMAQATTPKMTKAASTGPSVSVAIRSMRMAACPSYRAMAAFSPATSPQKAMPMAAQIMATIDSEIIAP